MGRPSPDELGRNEFARAASPSVVGFRAAERLVSPAAVGTGGAPESGAVIGGAIGFDGGAIVAGTLVGAVGRVLAVARSVVVSLGSGISGGTTWGSRTTTGCSGRSRALTDRFGSERMAPNADANNAAVIATETAKLGPRCSGFG